MAGVKTEVVHIVVAIAQHRGKSDSDGLGQISYNRISVTKGK